MMMMKKEVKQLVSRVNRRQLTNTQKALLALLTAKEEWVARTSIRVPSVGARIRDLRKSEFGSFRVTCGTATTAKVTTRTPRQTFYRLDPNSVTLSRVTKAFKGVITTNTVTK